MTSHDIMIFSSGALFASFVILAFAALGDFIAIRRERKQQEDWAE